MSSRDDTRRQAAARLRGLPWLQATFMNLILILLPWALSAYLGWRHEKLRRTVRKLKKRIEETEYSAADSDWGQHYGDEVEYE